MKKSYTLMAIAFGLIVVSCGPSKKDAKKYNDDIVSIQEKLTPVHEAFIDQLDGHNIDSMKLTHINFVNCTKASLEECEKIKALDGDHEFSHAVIEYFKAVKGLAEQEGTSMVEILSKDSTQMTEQDIIQVNQLIDKFNHGYEKILIKVQKAQEDFVKTWEFNLEK